VPRASNVITVVCSATPVMGTIALPAVVEVAPELATDDMPKTPKGVPEDVLEELEEELEMVSEPVPEVVLDEVPVVGVMINAHGAASPSHGAAEASSLAHRTPAAMDAATGVVREPEMVMGHPMFHASDDIPLDEAVNTVHRALSQAQPVLHWEDEDLTDERRCLQLWATMLKETMVTERVVAWAW
jgi:hypothetical protein